MKHKTKWKDVDRFDNNSKYAVVVYCYCLLLVSAKYLYDIITGLFFMNEK